MADLSENEEMLMSDLGSLILLPDVHFYENDGPMGRTFLS